MRDLAQGPISGHLVAMVIPIGAGTRPMLSIFLLGRVMWQRIL